MITFAEGIEVLELTRPIPGERHHAHCSTIVAFPNGELLAGWYWGITEADRKEEIFFSRRVPGDKEWTAPVPWGLKPRTMFDGNPVLWIAPDTGILHLFHNVGYGWSFVWLKHKTSTDRGFTWAREKDVYPFISRGVKNPPILTEEGTYVLPAYVEFKYLRGVFYISTNQGKSWRQSRFVDLDPAIIPPGYEKKKGRQVEQPTVIQRGDGSLFALFRNDGQPMRHMLQSTSNDGGLHWTPATNHVLPNPAGGFHMMRLQSGNVAIIYNHAPAPGNDYKWRNPLSVALSTDEGRSWQYRRNIAEWHPGNDNDWEKQDNENDGREAGGDEDVLGASARNRVTFEYPTMTQGADGTIHATWSISHVVDLHGDGRSMTRVTDIQYTSFKEEWIKERPFWESAWR